jgi:hypothetical protein
MFGWLRRRHPSATMIVALLALVAASAGVGNAATSLITGKQIKDGSVTGKDIKNKSVPLSKLSGKLPAGKTGPAGAAGATGPAGPAGATGPAGPVDKTIPLDITGAGGSATFPGGFGQNGGLSFADAANNSANFHLVLPANYTAGTPLTGTFTWHTGGVACGVVWQANYTSVSRVGQAHPVGLSATSGMTDPGALVTGATANIVQSGTFTLTSPQASFVLQPGDSYTFGLFRSGGASADTCAAPALIDSMVVSYS